MLDEPTLDVLDVASRISPRTKAVVAVHFAGYAADMVALRGLCGDRGLVLMDQLAAHERVLFEQMLERMERGDQSPAQKLLLPETVELSVRDATFLREQLHRGARLPPRVRPRCLGKARWRRRRRADPPQPGSRRARAPPRASRWRA